MMKLLIILLLMLGIGTMVFNSHTDHGIQPLDTTSGLQQSDIATVAERLNTVHDNQKNLALLLLSIDDRLNKLAHNYAQ